VPMEAARGGCRPESREITKCYKVGAKKTKESREGAVNWSNRAALQT